MIAPSHEERRRGPKVRATRPRIRYHRRVRDSCVPTGRRAAARLTPLAAPACRIASGDSLRSTTPTIFWAALCGFFEKCTETRNRSVACVIRKVRRPLHFFHRPVWILHCCCRARVLSWLWIPCMIPCRGSSGTGRLIPWLIHRMIHRWRPTRPTRPPADVVGGSDEVARLSSFQRCLL